MHNDTHTTNEENSKIQSPSQQVAGFTFAGAYYWYLTVTWTFGNLNISYSTACRQTFRFVFYRWREKFPPGRFLAITLRPEDGLGRHLIDLLPEGFLDLVLEGKVGQQISTSLKIYLLSRSKGVISLLFAYRILCFLWGKV